MCCLGQYKCWESTAPTIETSHEISLLWLLNWLRGNILDLEKDYYKPWSDGVHGEVRLFLESSGE